MTDELKLRRQIEQAAQAKSLLENEMLNETFSKLEETYLREWHSTKAGEVEFRENLWRACIVLSHVKAHLRKVLDGGKLAQDELDATEISNPRKVG